MRVHAMASLASDALTGRNLTLLRIAGSLTILALLVWALPFADLASALRRVTPEVWPLAIGGYLALHLIGVAKWRMLVNVAGAGLSMPDAARAYYWGLFGNTFLPSIVGGDVVKAGMAMRVAKFPGGVLLGSLVDRLLDVAGLILIAGIGALLSPRALDPRSQRIFITALAVLAGVGAIAAVAVLLAARDRIPTRLQGRLARIRDGLRATAAQPGAMVTALGMGAALQTLLIVLNYWLGLVIGIDIPLYVWLFVWPLAKIAALLPVSQGGIGVREVAIAVLFAPFGVPAAAAVASGLVFEAVIIGGGLIGGAAVSVMGRPSRVA